MKRHLLLALISMLACTTHAERYLVENYLGINCIEYTVKSKETLYNVAQQFFVRPSTLALVNNINDVEEVNEGKRMFIPLTETNFYTEVGLESSEFTFSPILYKTGLEENWQDVGYQFFVSEESLKEWNSTQVGFQKGRTVIVGWLKHQLVVSEQGTPRFVRKEKIVYGTETEKLEARNNETVLTSTVSIAQPDLNNYAVSTEAMPKENVLPTKKKKRGVKSLAKKVKEATQTIRLRSKKTDEAKVENGAKIEVKKEEKTTEPEEELLAKKKEPKVEEASKIEVKKIEKITEPEEEFLLAKKKNPKVKRKSGLLTKVKELTQNSYARDKERLKTGNEFKDATKSNKVSSITKNKKLVTEKAELDAPAIKKEVVQEVVESKKAVKTVALQPEVKSDAEESLKVKKEESIIDPTYVQNKMQRLTLMKSVKGRAVFFSSKTAGAKFYVYTNLAGKGSIVKLTNQNNKKYILAEVIGLLPDADRKRGYLVKLSDNSRRILSTSSKSFSAKINY